MNPTARISKTCEKAALRDQMKSLRAALPLEDRQAYSAAVSRHLIDWLERSWLPARPNTGIGIYLATPTEINIDEVTRRLQTLGVPVGAPLVGLHDPHLTFHTIGDPSTVALGNFRIREPARTSPQVPVSLVLVPGTAFTLQGHRLGMGHGCYDRTLLPQHFTIGVGYSLQIVSELPVERHDRRLNAIATPDGVTLTGA